MPMIPMLAIFAAHGIASVAGAIRARDVRLLSWSLPLLVAIFFFVHRDPGNSPTFDAQNRGIVGEMFLHAGRPREAVEEFRAAIAFFEGYPGDSTGDQYRRVVDSSRFGIALARQDGAPVSDEEVIAGLRAASEALDTDLRHDVLVTLGGLLAGRGDAAGAVDAFSRAIQADPNDVDTMLRLAEAQHKAGRPDDALATAARVVSRFPDAGATVHASAHFGQALVYLSERADPVLAAEHLRAVLRLDPAHPRAEWIRARLAALPSSGDDR
jgi:tetratricopeptide (TPR) repeat protein